MDVNQSICLLDLAKKYVWWKTAEVEVNQLPHLMAQVFTFGTWNDAYAMYIHLGDQHCKELLKEAPPGIFNKKSWNFWHLLLKEQQIPALPARKLPY